MAKRTIASDAEDIVFGVREQDYGTPERNLSRIGIIWGTLLGIDPLPPRQVAVLLTAMKLVRASGRENRDDLLDGIGYLILADEATK
jgi:hypothetical protein